MPEAERGGGKSGDGLEAVINRAQPTQLLRTCHQALSMIISTFADEILVAWVEGGDRRL